MSKTELKRSVERLESLPTLTSVAIQLLHQTTDENANAESIARVIESDQTLTARLLRLVNSASYQFRSEVTTVQRAVSLLGFNAIRSFALGLAVTDILREGQGNWVFDAREFWKHALATAVCAELLARKSKRIADPSEVFIAGLLHDLGKVVLSTVAREQYDTLMGRVKDGAGALLELEEAEFGATHAEAGKWLAERWGLPERLCHAIWLHHHPLSALPPAEFHVPAVALVQVADQVVRSLLIGFSGNDRMEALTAAQLDAAGIRAADVDEVRRVVAKRVEERAAVIDLDLTETELYLEALQQANARLANMVLRAEAANHTIERRERRFTALHEMNTRLQPRQTLDDVLTVVAETLRDGFEVRSGACYIVDAVARAVDGKFWTDNAAVRDLSVSMTENRVTATESFRDMRPQVAAVLAESALMFDGDNWLGFRVRHIVERNDLVVVPIVSGGRNIGQIVLDYQGDETRGRPGEDMAELFAFAAAAGLAISRVRTLETLSRRSEELVSAISRHEQAHKQLLHAERLTAVGKMAAGAAHEINNPLAIISGRAQIMLQKEQDDARKKALQSIVDQCVRASRILQDLMGFARPTPPKTEAANINSVVHAVLNLFESRLGARGIELRSEFAPDLPSVFIDKGQIEQVLVNLLMNAEHATGRNGSITVATGVTRQGDRVFVRVTDKGTGIPPEHLESIFEPFFTTKEEGKGTGLGLSLAYGIITSHQGDIQVESEVGKGTTFTVLLPVTANLVSMSEQMAVRAMRERPRVEDSAPRILVVDDEEQMRRLISEALTDAGYLVEEAHNGVEALEKLRRVQVDLVTLDIRMPRMDGKKMLRMLRETLPDLPVIVVTGLASHEDVVEAKELGVSACLRKPFNLDDLTDAVRKALADAGAAAEKTHRVT